MRERIIRRKNQTIFFLEYSDLELFFKLCNEVDREIYQKSFFFFFLLKKSGTSTFPPYQKKIASFPPYQKKMFSFFFLFFLPFFFLFCFFFRTRSTPPSLASFGARQSDKKNADHQDLVGGDVFGGFCVSL